MHTPNSTPDISNGWEAIAHQFIASRNPKIGQNTIRSWAQQLLPAGQVLDLGCGFGTPATGLRIEEKLRVFGIDASPTLVSEYKKRFPEAQVRCEAAEESDFFGEKFEGAIAIGLLFLLSEQQQLQILGKVADCLVQGGRFLFTSPHQVCSWHDALTGQPSQSLGKEVYVRELLAHGLTLFGESQDEGGNHYFDFCSS